MNEPLELMMTSITAQGSLIVMIARSPAGERYVVQCPFEAYFFIPTAEAETADWKDAKVRIEPGHKSALNGEPLSRIVVASPAEVSRRRRGKTHHEANVLYPRRFLIDTGIVKGFRVERYEVVNAEYNVIRAWPHDLTPLDVDAPMFGMKLDIETNRAADGKFSKPTKAEGAVTAVSWDPVKWSIKDGIELVENKRITFQWHPSNKEFGRPRVETRWKYSFAWDREIEWEIWTYATEPEMLLAFTQYVKNTRPDFWTAWNGHYGFKTSRAPGGTGGFDAPYLINRLDKIGIGSNQLSPFNHTVAKYVKLGEEGRFVWRCEIAGIQLIDLMTTYSVKDGGMVAKVPFFGLKAVVESKTKMPIHKDPESIQDWWLSRNDRFLDYSFQDIDGISILERLEDYIGYLKRFQWLVGMEDANTLFSPSTLIDTLVLRKARELGVVLPTGGDDVELDWVPEKGAKGGYVKKPIKAGLLKDYIIVDFSAMYVEIMQAANVGLDTLVHSGMEEREDDIVIPLKDDWSQVARFRSPDFKLGVIPQVLDLLRSARKVYDDKIALAKTPAEIKALKKDREPAKQLLLSAYGVQLLPSFRLAHPLAGLAIPAMGRFLAKKADAWAAKVDEPFVRMDTDSGMKDAPEGVDVVKYGHWMEEQMGKAADAAARDLRIKKHNLSMGFEKAYSSFVGGETKKRYAGIIHWAEGVYADPPHTPKCPIECKHLEYAGGSLATEGAALISKEVERFVLRGLLDEKPIDQLLKYAKTMYDAVKNGEIDVADVVEKQKLGFDPEHDDKDTDVVKGARNAMDLYGLDFKKGEQVRIIRLKAVNPWLTIPVDDDIPKDVKVDWEYHALHAVLNPLKEVFSWVNEDERLDAIARGLKPTKQQRLVIG